MSHQAKTDTHCPACARVIPKRRWRYARLSWDLREEKLPCLCGNTLSRKARKT